MDDETRNLIKSCVAAAVVGVIGAFLCHYLASHSSSGASRVMSIRAMLLLAGLTGLAVPKVAEWIGGVVGYILALPILCATVALAVTLAVLSQVNYGGIELVQLTVGAVACIGGGIIGAIFESVQG